MKTILICALTLSVGMAHAELFKCVDASGATSYQDWPCKAGSNAGRMDVDVAPTGFAPDPKLMERGKALDERMKKAAEPPPTQQTPSAGRGPTIPTGGGHNSYQVDERKFLALQHSHIGEFPIDEAQVLDKLGEPDRRVTIMGETCPTVTGATIKCVGETWIYEPAGSDSDVRTVIRFDGAGKVVNVDRQLVRR